MTERVVRVIAILFLVYTGADLTSPEFCGEEMGIPSFAQTASSTGGRTDAASATDASESQDSPSEPIHSDEDCFCCCTHVLPGHATAPVDVPEFTSLFAALRLIDVASAPLKSPYHPPRFA
jgi:hypothetical protein